MKSRFLLTVFAPLFLAACSASTPSPTATTAPTAIPSPTPTLAAPTSTPAPPRVTLTVKSELVNCRFGPGVAYELINELKQGETARVAGRNLESTWWYVHDPGNPNGYCWVSADVTEIQGDAEKLPVEPNPFVSVTDVSLRVEPSRILINCDQFPQTVFLEAEVTTNGPAFVQWRWEASTGVSSTDTILVFERSGLQVINDYYQVNNPGDYWIKLRVLAPNEAIEEVKFPVNCTR